MAIMGAYGTVHMTPSYSLNDKGYIEMKYAPTLVSEVQGASIEISHTLSASKKPNCLL